MGMQADGCPHDLSSNTLQSYLDFLSANGFNAVRLPLSADWVNNGARTVDSQCGEYSGQAFTAVLADVLTRLRGAGLRACSTCTR